MYATALAPDIMMPAICAACASETPKAIISGVIKPMIAIQNLRLVSFLIISFFIFTHSFYTKIPRNVDISPPATAEIIAVMICVSLAFG